MNRNKMTIIMMICFVGIICSSIVCANETINVDNVEFNIPPGYQSSDILMETSATPPIPGVDTSMQQDNIYKTTLKNNAGDEIKISVKKPHGETLDGKSISIDGKEGIINNDDGECTFLYEEDNHLIVITASNQSIIEEVIK